MKGPINWGEGAKLTFELLEDYTFGGIFHEPETARQHPYDLHCPGCGRYAKFLRVERGFNGSCSTETLYTNCASCGVLYERTV
jgi:hypothetical protein